MTCFLMTAAAMLCTTRVRTAPLDALGGRAAKWFGQAMGDRERAGAGACVCMFLAYRGRVDAEVLRAAKGLHYFIGKARSCWLVVRPGRAPGWQQVMLVKGLGACHGCHFESCCAPMNCVVLNSESRP